MKKIFSILTAAALFGALLLPGLCACVSSAGPSYWEGAITGSAYAEGPCSVGVKEEKLTLSVPDLPFTAERGNCTATAEYTLSNPLGEDATFRVFIPAGTVLAYELSQEGEGSDVSAFLDGKEIPAAARYTDKDLYGGLPQPPLPAPRTDLFLRADSEYVTLRYTCTAEREGEIVLALSYNPDRTRVFPLDGGYGTNNGALVLVGPEMRGGFSYVGEPPAVNFLGVYESDADSWDYQDYDHWEGSLREERTACTLKEAFAQNRPQGVGEIDWINICLLRLENAANGIGVCFPGPGAGGTDGVSELYEWRECEVTVPAGGEAVLKTTAHLFPSIFGNRYTFRYFLSPARRWAFYGGVDLSILTDFQIDGEWTFEEVEGGYHVRMQGLPLDEIDFSIGWEEKSDPLADLAKGASIFFGLLVAIGLIVFVCVRLSRRRKGEGEGRKK